MAIERNIGEIFYRTKSIQTSPPSPDRAQNCQRDKFRFLFQKPPVAGKIKRRPARVVGTRNINLARRPTLARPIRRETQDSTSPMISRRGQISRGARVHLPWAVCFVATRFAQGCSGLPPANPPRRQLRPRPEPGRVAARIPECEHLVFFHVGFCAPGFAVRALYHAQILPVCSRRDHRRAVIVSRLINAGCADRPIFFFFAVTSAWPCTSWPRVNGAMNLKFDRIFFCDKWLSATTT